MYKQISSPQNQEIKNLLALQEKARERKKQGLFLVEGLRELTLAIAGKYVVEKIYFVPDLINPEELEALQPYLENCIEITAEVYQKIAYRESTEGVIALLKSKFHTLDVLKFNKPNPLILVAEAPEKPGNIGALLRTADAAGVDAVILSNPTTDIYNPNVIRSSVGCVFTNQIGIGTNEEVIEFLSANHIQILTAALTEKAENYLSQDFTKPTAIVVGTESTGLTDIWLDHADKSILIPMQGKIDSMNVSVAAAVLIFEAIRQRENLRI